MEIYNSGEKNITVSPLPSQPKLLYFSEKPGMSPVFEIDGLEYTAMRTFDRFGATINCSLTHPEEVEIPPFLSIVSIF